jgi:hypothetical protein
MFLLDKLRGSSISISRLQDNIQSVFNLVGVIAAGQLVAGATTSVPLVLPATFTVSNPLQRTAQGAIVVLQSQACVLKLISSTASSLTFALSPVPKTQNGVPYGNWAPTGSLTFSYWVF